MKQFIKLAIENEEVIFNVSHIRWIRKNSDNDSIYNSIIGVDYNDNGFLHVIETPGEIMDIINGITHQDLGDKKSNSNAVRGGALH